MRSSAPEAKTALTAALRDHGELADALVREGLLTTVPRKRERVYVLRRIDDARRERAAEQRIFEETYLIQVLLEVRTAGGDDGGPSEQRAYELFAVLEDVIETDPELGGAIDDCAIETFDSATAPVEDGWVTQIRVSVRAGAIVS